MKIAFISDSLSEKIPFLNHAISQRGQLPILSNFLLTARSGKLIISATDLEIGISTTIPVSIEEEGQTTIPAKIFSDLFSNLKSQKISLNLEGQTLKLIGEKVKASFQTMSHEEFPALFEQKGEELVSIKRANILEYVSRVVFASAIDSTRPALSGVLMEGQKSEAIMVATDGYRLSLQKNVFRANAELKAPIVIPARLIRELMLIKENSDEVKIFVLQKNNQIIFSQGETILVGRLIDSSYPEYEKIIPNDFATKTLVNKDELLSAIKICTVFARETANIVKFSVQKEKLIVSANSPSVGEDSVEVEAKTTGEENEIAFNAKYLLDFLSNIDKEDLVFEMTGPLNPGVFKIKGDDSFLHLIMPIRVQE